MRRASRAALLVATSLASLASSSLAAAAQERPAPPPVRPAADAETLAAVERGSVRALLEIAERRARSGDLAGATEPLRAALSLAPSSERALAAWARTAMASRAPGPALLALEPLARMHPGVPEYSYLLGVAWMQLGDMQSALPHLERARELEPRRALTLVAIGLAHNQSKRYPEAKAVLEEALRLAPEDPEALAAMAEAEEGLGEHDAAERHARRALELAPRHGEALLVLGLVHMQRERHADARAAFESSLAAAPGSARAHYQLSLACARLGDRDCAAREVALYQKALREIEERLVAIRRQSLEAGQAQP